MWHDLFTPADEARGIPGLREGYDRFFEQFNAPSSTKISSIKIDQASALWVDPKGIDNKRVVLHLHGGGFAFGSADCSVEYAARLALAVNGRCLAVNYRLAPEHPFPAALDDAVAAYRFLITQGFTADSIFISGKSAGAGLAVALAMEVRDHGLPRAAGLITLSPFVDCTLASESISRLEGQDPIIDRDILTYMSRLFPGHAAR